MRDYERYLGKLRKVPANGTPERLAAIDLAVSTLQDAGVMDRSKGDLAAGDSEKTFGQFIKSRRELLLPPVSQTLISDRIGLSTDWYRKAEQDSAPNLSIEGMCRIGIGLRMSDGDIQDMLVQYTVGKDPLVIELTAQELLRGMRNVYDKSGKLPRGRFKG